MCVYYSLFFNMTVLLTVECAISSTVLCVCAHLMGPGFIVFPFVRAISFTDSTDGSTSPCGAVSPALLKSALVTHQRSQSLSGLQVIRRPSRAIDKPL